jgi:hypothetical protein
MRAVQNWAVPRRLSRPVAEYCMSSNPFTISRASCAGEPGVENMLEHAPPPLTANGLDMRDGHPAAMKTLEASQARFSRLGALTERGKKHKPEARKRKSIQTGTMREVTEDA